MQSSTRHSSSKGSWKRIILTAILLSVDVSLAANNHNNMQQPQHLSRGDDPHRTNQRYYDNTVTMEQPMKRGRGPTDYYSHLSDVWLCLAMALGWTVCMLSSLVRSDLARYQKDSILVRGHVLQVSVEEDAMGSGLPTYRAVIDYMVNSPVGDNKIQVRKHFATQHLLEQGFANVEILVIPQEPTSSVLKEVFQQQVEDQKEDEQEALIRPTFCKRLSMTFSFILVLVSLGACVQAVVHLDPLERWKGWVLLCIGATVLLPTGLFVHRALQVMHRTMELHSENAGIILKGATNTMQNLWDNIDDMLDPQGACEDNAITETIRDVHSKCAPTGEYFVELKSLGQPNKSPSNVEDTIAEKTTLPYEARSSHSTVSSLSTPADFGARSSSISTSKSQVSATEVEVNCVTRPYRDNEQNDAPLFSVSDDFALT
ncbi:hypothetical protein FisN_18Hh198 [Fistulifera solaris]|uniref:Uncharacterized protein n=1 Tax=Fistulifera solaris TaxID=1519565 RepID=A0A1Z5JVA8_FISSO|nr:hypothetical protein FisN_18Hh198 [Fistulifera solaris]|eukprot:GAX17985.1 hypothetical protein FisN_18Hh198 [Fistulifera solaris]